MGYDNPIVAVGDGDYDFYSYYAGIDAFYYIGYRNPSAKYTFTSDSKNFTMEEVKFDAGNSDEEEFAGVSYVYGYKYKAKKAGVYTITVKETYNKKTTKLGSFKVEVKDAYVDENVVELRVGDIMDAFYYVYYTKADTMYFFTIEDYDESKPENNVISLIQDDESLVISGQVPGTAKVTVREGSNTGTVIGTMNVKVYS